MKSCPNLVAPTDGQKSSNVSTCGSTVTFHCNECFELEGPGERTCLENRTWSGLEPTCTGQFIFLLNTFCLLLLPVYLYVSSEVLLIS